MTKSDAEVVKGKDSKRKERLPARGKRYSFAVKQEILTCAQEHGVEAAVNKYGVTSTSIYEWIRAAKRREKETDKPDTGEFQKYAHVLVDEIQDFSLEVLRLIKALSPIEEETRDPLCTAGDGHQRIYRTKIPLSRAGINIRGRSRRLKINYRTSEQIRKFAQGILRGIEIDDLDGGTAIIVGDHSAFKGPEPVIAKCTSVKEEADKVVDWVKNLMEEHGLATHDICITPYKPEVRSALTAAEIPTYQLKPREDDPGSDIPGIRLGTIKRIKGLEFRAVALACADQNDPMNNLDEAGPLERCERYVASMRAREHLLVTVGKH